MSVNLNERLWFDTTQAADYSGHHRATVQAALAAGELHGGQRRDVKTGRPRRGGHWKIHRDCLDAWLSGVPCQHQREAS